MKQIAVLLGLVAACLLVGALGGWITAQSVTDWYPTIAKPSWTPPNWLFAPVWTLLYIIMAVAAWLVWKTGQARGALVLFGAQLLLNLSWSFLFFGARSPGLGLATIVVLWLAIAATIFAFTLKNRLAGFLLVPYLAWVSYATALNAAIWTLN